MWSDIEVGLAAAKTDREAKRAELDAVRAKVNQLSQHQPGEAGGSARRARGRKQGAGDQGAKAGGCDERLQELKKCQMPGAPAAEEKERQQRCVAEEAKTASQLQEERRHLQARVDELRRKMQKAPREREALTNLKTQLLFSLAVAQRLESLVQAKDEASARRKSAEDKYHPLLKEREAEAERKSQLDGQTAFQHQAMQSKLSVKKGVSCDENLRNREGRWSLQESQRSLVICWFAGASTLLRLLQVLLF
ncbi:GRB10-interacting GYF protein 2-like [Ixodes scapularis]|uniref:GRB10-interacting GYF protein 2-like n=1 Tax=Ixodes scapularis TaxID=6945 RepID=UPI001A9E5A21|nr:GRB10-interacting GYF protein 2-like [Ixodes scapularis]